MRFLERHKERNGPGEVRGRKWKGVERDRDKWADRYFGRPTEMTV